MSSWCYAYFFSGVSGDQLTLQKVVECISENKLKFDSSISLSKEVDDKGHLEELGEEIILDEPILDSLGSLLSSNEQFLVECRNPEMMFACSFAAKYKNPHFVLGWSNKIFARLKQDSQELYFDMFLNVAKKSSAEYVIFVNDPPDYFEDKFSVVDDAPILDTHTSAGTPYEIVEVWIKEGSLVPESVKVIDVKVEFF